MHPLGTPFIHFVPYLVSGPPHWGLVSRIHYGSCFTALGSTTVVALSASFI